MGLSNIHNVQLLNLGIAGNILMISEGRPLIDNRYYLKDGTTEIKLSKYFSKCAPGTLYLELDKPTYERCGLLGRPTRSSGRVHMKSRYRWC